MNQPSVVVGHGAVPSTAPHSQATTIPAGAWGRVALDDFDAVASVNTVFTERYTQIRRGRAAVLRAVRTWRRWLVVAMHDPGMLVDPAAVERMEEEVLGAYLDAVQVSTRALHNFGYFAMDYRRMFGEGPRETLRRGRGGRRTAPAVVPATLARESRGR